MSKQNYVFRQFALFLRGPLTTVKEHVLPKHVYEQAAKTGMLQLLFGGDTHTVVKSALESLATAASTQLLPQPDEIGCHNIGPWQAFGGIAMDMRGNCSVMHRKHPNMVSCVEFVENSGILNDEYESVSFAGLHEDVKNWKNRKDVYDYLHHGGKMIGYISLHPKPEQEVFIYECEVGDGYIMPNIMQYCDLRTTCK